jgi:transcriptional regulator with XRE-family HTH domain
VSNDEKWVGKALRLRRSEKDWTLEELKRRLAKQRIHVDEATICRWERTRVPRDDQRVARALGRIFKCSSIAFYREPFVDFIKTDDSEE